MAVRILHAADFHLDSPFHALGEEKARRRRSESRELLGEIADLCERERVQLVLLAGDLFDSGVSYFETQDTLISMLRSINAEVFISPGNHDYYSSRSPYAFMELPENVHIFRSPQLRYVDIPDLGVRVWGAGFSSPVCDDILAGFRAGKSGLTELMVLHADLGGKRYCPITEDEIADSGLHYLALGHVHAFSGVRKAGDTYYAYPGCLEGRGFDETGAKGVLLGDVGADGVSLDFIPIARRQYVINEISLSGAESAMAAVMEAVGDGDPQNAVRILLRGEFSGPVDTAAITEALEGKFYALQVKNETVPARSVWDGADEDSLKGLFLSKLKASYDAAEFEADRAKYLAAAKYGVAALETREEWRP